MVTFRSRSGDCNLTTAFETPVVGTAPQRHLTMARHDAPARSPTLTTMGGCRAPKAWTATPRLQQLVTWSPNVWWVVASAARWSSRVGTSDHMASAFNSEHNRGYSLVTLTNLEALCSAAHAATPDAREFRPARFTNSTPCFGAQSRSANQPLRHFSSDGL